MAKIYTTNLYQKRKSLPVNSQTLTRMMRKRITLYCSTVNHVHNFLFPQKRHHMWRHHMTIAVLWMHHIVPIVCLMSTAYYYSALQCPALKVWQQHVLQPLNYLLNWNWRPKNVIDLGRNRKGAKEREKKEKIPPTPGFEPQVSQCLVGATLSSTPGGLASLPHQKVPSVLHPITSVYLSARAELVY